MKKILVFGIVLAVIMLLVIPFFQSMYFMPKKIERAEKNADKIGFKRGFDSGMHVQSATDKKELADMKTAHKKETAELKNQLNQFQKKYNHARNFVDVYKTNWLGEKILVEARKEDVKPIEE